MQKNNKWKTILAIMLRFLCGVPLFCPSPDLREKRLTELKDQKSTGRGKVRKMVPVISHPTRLFGGGWPGGILRQELTACVRFCDPFHDNEIMPCISWGAARFRLRL